MNREITDLLEIIQAERAQNTDSRKKEIGDRVKIWDFSDAYCVERDNKFTIFDHEARKEFIIVEFGEYPIGWHSEAEKEMWNRDMNPRGCNNVKISDGNIHVCTKVDFLQLADFRTSNPH